MGTFLLWSQGDIFIVVQHKKNPGDMSVALRGRHPVQPISWQDLVHGGHAGFHVFVNVAVEHPRANVVENHIRGDELCGQEGKNIRAVAVDRDHVASPQPPIDSVAVLPFENCSGDPELDYLCHGLYPNSCEYAYLLSIRKEWICVSTAIF